MFFLACSGLLGSIWLLGYMPPRVRNYQNMLRPVVDMFAQYAPGKDPMVIFDASLGVEVTKWLVCAVLVNDIRGVPNATCGKSPPCLVGSCNMCNVGGHYHRACTAVSSAVLSLPQTSPLLSDLLKKYRMELKHAHVQQGGVPLTEVGDAGPPRNRTKKERRGCRQPCARWRVCGEG